jgi:predicted nucleotidyltransferase
MRRDEVIAALRAHEPELKSAGVEAVRIFGSVARDDATDASDVDLVVRLRPELREGGFAYFGRLDELANRLSTVLGCSVDLVAEPVRKARLRQQIEREAARAF